MTLSGHRPFQTDRLSRYDAIVLSLRGGHEAAGISSVASVARRRWPLAARAQQRERMRRIGVLDARGRGRSGISGPLGAFLQGLGALGWTVGRNVRIDTAGSAATSPTFAGTRRNWSRSRRTSSWPMAATTWRVAAGDPHRADRVRACRRSGRRRLRRQPGAAGRQRHRLHVFEYGMSGKWLELLKQIAPGVTRAAVLRDPATPAGHRPIRRAIQSVAPSLGVEVSPVNVRDAARSSAPSRPFARPNGGLIVTASAPRRLSSRSDRHAGGPAQAARGLLRTAPSSPPAA